MSAGEARYLLALLDLPGAADHDLRPPSMAALARRVGVSGPTALEMLRRLRALDLIDEHAVALTPAGISAALVLRSRQKAALTLLTDVLGFEPEAAESEATWLATSGSTELGRHLVAWRGHGPKPARRRRRPRRAAARPAVPPSDGADP